MIIGIATKPKSNNNTKEKPTNESCSLLVSQEKDFTFNENKGMLAFNK